MTKRNYNGEKHTFKYLTGIQRGKLEQMLEQISKLRIFTQEKMTRESCESVDFLVLMN